MVLILTATGCHETSRDVPKDRLGVLAAHNATVTPLLPTNAFAMPSFDVATYETLIEQLKGTPVVVNIWSSWCGPCRKEAPELARASSEYGDQVQFLGVDILDTRADAADFVKEFGWGFPSVFDSSGAIRDHLGFVGQPETIFIDSAGHVVTNWTGPLTAEALQTNLSRIL